MEVATPGPTYLICLVYFETLYIYSTNICTVYIHIYACICIRVYGYTCMHVHVIEYSVVTQCITGHKTRIGNEASDGYCLPVVFAKQQLENGNVKHAKVFRRQK